MEQSLPQIKVIVVGDSGVGKSSILFRFVNDEFNEFSEATLGAAFVSKVHTYAGNKTIRFQVEGCRCRCGIPPDRRSTSPSPPSTTEVSPALSRIADRPLRLRHHQQAVLQRPQELGGGAAHEGTRESAYAWGELVLAVVGNKVDRSEEEAVSYNETKDYAQSVNAIFKLTSAKDGKGINVIHRPLRNSSQPSPRSWRSRNSPRPTRTDAPNCPRGTTARRRREAAAAARKSELSLSWHIGYNSSANYYMHLGYWGGSPVEVDYCCR